MVMTLTKGASKEEIQSLLKKLNKTKKTSGINAYKYLGIITLKDSPKHIQIQLRSEW